MNYCPKMDIFNSCGKGWDKQQPSTWLLHKKITSMIRQRREYNESLHANSEDELINMSKYSDDDEPDRRMIQVQDENPKQQIQTHQQRSGLFSFLSQSDVKLLGVFTFLAVLVRMALIENPSVVVFDEVHFGGFAAKYLRGEFFFDVHPPLARLLVTLSGWLSGFKGDFNFFDIGVDYKRHGVPYVGMRAFSAIFGIATVPFAYVTVKALGGSRWAATAASLLVLFENSLITQSRLILLDSYLIFFTTATLMFWSMFKRAEGDKHNTYSSIGKWTALALTGVGLGGASSCKWVGLFTVASIGVQVIAGLWRMWCNTLVPLNKIFKSIIPRAICLILLPLTIYVSTFYIHFLLLPKFTQSAAGFTLQFQQSFKEGRLPPTNGPVYFGSTITIRQDRRDNPGYLHSHDVLYPTGSKQQQVTMYHHKDSNNNFLIKRPFIVNVTYTEEDLDGPMEEEDLINLRHGDQVRLLHVNTGRFLHSHNELAPLSQKKEHHAEVSGYGHDESRFSDLNDNWVVQLVGKDGVALPQPSKREDSPTINAVKDRLMFLHPFAGCILHSNNKVLPDWGFKQGEVTCGREVLKEHTQWIIESNNHPLHVEDEENFQVEQRKAGFWEKFVELHGRMWVVNAGLTSSHYFQSKPQEWPFLRRGLGFWNGGQIPRSESEINADKSEKNPKGIVNPVIQVSPEEKEANRQSYAEQAASMKGKQIYLLGNLVTWHVVTIGILTILLLTAGSIVINQRIRFAPGYGKTREFIGFIFETIELESPVGFLFTSWFLHYVPFFLMGRQLFLHHYLPALYCGILFLVMFMDRIVETKYKKIAFVTLVSAALAAYLLYLPLAYGTPFKLCSALKLKKSWDWDC